jgi:hypothetical protein
MYREFNDAECSLVCPWSCSRIRKQLARLVMCRLPCHRLLEIARSLVLRL